MQVHPLRMLCRTCGGDGQIALTRCGLIMASRTTGSIIATERCEDCDGDGWTPWPWPVATGPDIDGAPGGTETDPADDAEPEDEDDHEHGPADRPDDS